MLAFRFDDRRILYLACFLIAASFRLAGGQEFETSIPVVEGSAESVVEAELDAIWQQLGDLQAEQTTPSRRNRAASSHSRWLHPHGGWFGQFEQLFIRHQSSESDETTNESFRSTQRITLGWIGDEGRSLRVRYFAYPPTLYDGDESLFARTFDGEYAGRFELGRLFQGELLGGLRWSRFNDSDIQYGDAIGPLIGAEIRSPLDEHWAFYANGRYSIQFGNATFLDESPEDKDFPGGYATTEMQVGLEFRRSLRWLARSPVGFLRLGLEGQRFSGLADHDSEDISFLGGAVAFGFRR